MLSTFRAFLFNPQVFYPESHLNGKAAIAGGWYVAPLGGEALCINSITNEDDVQQKTKVDFLAGFAVAALGAVAVPVVDKRSLDAASVEASKRDLVEGCAVCGGAVEDDAKRKEVGALLEPVDPGAAWRWSHCHEPGFGWVGECPQNINHPSVYIPFSCMLRICPQCAAALASKSAHHYRKVVERIMDEQWYKVKWGWRLRHITLTCEYELGKDDAGNWVLFLLNAARDLFREMWGSVEGAGALAGCEVGPNGKKYHIHFLVWSPFPKAADLKAIWHKLTGQTYVHIEMVGTEFQYRGGNLDEITWKLAKYVTKYACKEIDESLTASQLVSLHRALKGRRRVRSWGSFFGVKVDDTKPARVCETCGAALRYTSELDWTRRQLNGFSAVGASMFLKEQITSEQDALQPSPQARLPNFLAVFG